ncbi:MAG TPA: hypothetical protein VGL29_22275 [Blastocatellia bacterium]|jgi:hypothetical protein
MDESQQETIAIKACVACRSGLLERDKFCRWCGASQSDPLSLTLVSARENASACETTTLATGARPAVYRPISTPLVSAVLTGTLVGTSTVSQSPLIKRLILALVSIPVWLIIVLLSPLDAYTTVKSLERQI